MSSEATKENKAPSLLKAAWIIAVVTIVSKLIGFVRDIIIANYYGASLVSDAYYYAYQIPSLSLILLGGVGGPFHSATVAIFSKLIPNLKQIIFNIYDCNDNLFLSIISHNVYFPKTNYGINYFRWFCRYD